MKICTKQILTLTVCTLSVIANSYATVHTGPIIFDNVTDTLQGGDTYVYGTGSYVFEIKNSSVVTVDPSSSGIAIKIGTEESPLSTAYTIQGVRVNSASTLNLGTGSFVTAYTSVTDPVFYGFAVAFANMNADSGLNITINGTHKGVGIIVSNSGTVDIGTDANISVSRAGLIIYQGGILEGRNSRIDARGGEGYESIGVKMMSGTVTLDNVDITSRDIGIYMATASGNYVETVGTLNLIGGSVYSANGAAISAQKDNPTSETALTQTLNISNGAQISSGAGILFSNAAADTASDLSALTINISDANTKVDGRIEDGMLNHTLTVKISDNATWSSEGSSNIDQLILDNANLELTLTDTTDSITVGELSTSGSNDILIDFGNDFLNEITDGFMFDTDTAIIIGSGEKDNINYIIADHNKDGSTWDVTDNLDGTYTITNIHVVPEPATYATIFGALALTLAAYRKRSIAPKK